MRTLAVCVILLALSSFSASDPRVEDSSRIDVVWVTGTIMLLALTVQRVCQRLGLPMLWGWVSAGLIVGVTGLGVGNPSPQMQELVLCFCGMWAGLLVGIGFGWPTFVTNGRCLGIVTMSTVVGAAIVTIGCVLIAGQDWTTSLLVGAISALWGPLVVSSLWRDDVSTSAALTGTLVAIVLLTWVVGWLHESGQLVGDGPAFVARLWISPALGIAIAWLLQKARALKRRSVALVALVSITSFGAVTIQHYNLLGVAVGLGAGLTLSFRPEVQRTLDRLFGASRPLATFLFVALALSRLDIAEVLMPPTPGLFEIVLLQLIVLFCLRGLGPVLWQPHIAGASGVNGWLLLPKGILGIELVLVGGGLLSLLNRTDARLLQQLVVVDLLVYGLLTASLTGFMLQQQDKGQPTGSSG
jgi:Kef-type K+ transport system membrane component KefB